MSRPRDPLADDLDTKPGELVKESALAWVMWCTECRFAWLALGTDKKEARLRRMADRHNEEQPGHDAQVRPRGDNP